MRQNVPFPDHFSTGVVQFEDIPDLRPGDMVRVADGDQIIESYELLSVREDESVVVDVESRDNPQHFDKEAFEQELTQGTPNVWTLLNRATVSIDNAVSSSLVLFAYAFSHRGLPNDECMLAFTWADTPQDPVTSMPETEGMVSSMRFDKLRESLRTGTPVGDVKEVDESLTRLYDTFDDELLSEALDEFIVVAEFNATKLLSVYTEPTYDAETERRLERDAVEMEMSIRAANELYD